MKTKFLKLALCAMALLPMGAWAEEETVSTTTTWTFNSYTTSATQTTCGADVAKFQTEKLYNRSAASGRGFTFTEISQTLLSFSDGYTVSVNKYATAGGMTVNNNNKDSQVKTAGAVGNFVTAFMAFNTSVAGTCYALVENTTGDKNCRIYFTDGTTVVGETNSGDASATSMVTGNGNGTIMEIKSTPGRAGSFFIGGANMKIYSIRFVPTSEKKDEWVYIGSTGYATWGNNSGKDIESLPTGLTAYSATAGAAGSATVTLTSLAKMRRAQGYILKGTPNTNYDLTYGGETLGTEYNGGDMLRATADMADFAATITGDDSKTRYRYILGNDNGTAKFFVPSGSGTLKKGKAYLQTLKNLTASSARGINIIFDDEETTAIKSIDAKAVNNGKYYNLLGVEVAQPAKGLYIVNGKKVLIK